MSNVAAGLGLLRDELVAAAPQDASWEPMERWTAKAVPFFTRFLPEHLADLRTHATRPQVASAVWIGRRGDPGYGAEQNRRGQAEAEATNRRRVAVAHATLLSFIDGILAVVAEDLGEPDAQLTETASKLGRNVFIVHGHDHALKEEAARLLERLELNPVILHEQPNRGETVIEKFERNAGDAGFAIVLLTPDDLGCEKARHPEGAHPRGRQNVVFELGWFAGRLGRASVAVVYSHGVELPTDLGGIVWIAATGHWKLDVAKELRAAGFSIDLNRL